MAKYIRNNAVHTRMFMKPNLVTIITFKTAHCIKNLHTT